MISSGKLTLASKVFGDQCMEMTCRKPVKDCYCYSEMKKMCQRLSKLPQKCASSCHCTSQSESTSVKETDEMLVPPISCETFRQIQRINYIPKSQFLLRVQNKICELQSGSQRNCLRMCPRSFSYHRFMANGRRMQDIWDGKTAMPNERKHVDAKQKSRISPKTPANSLVSESDHDNTVCASSVRTSQVSSQNLVKSTLRKTIKSRRQVSELSKSLLSKSSIRKNNRKQDCLCAKMIRNQGDVEHIAKRVEDQLHTIDVPERFKENYRCLKCDDKFVDRKVQDLRRFREQYYFETHGSSHTLASSRSSGSLEQYFLNDRLFPEPVGKIHRRDLVVTMPPCVTTQKKRIHYFPRHVIRQEKDIYNSHYRLKQCQTNCPLTGHAIDLGAVKIKLPVDSLALKYQKKNLIR